MRILFINPPNIPFTDSSILIEPIDLLTIATITKKNGFIVDIIDMDIKKILSNDLKYFIKKEKYNYVVIVYDYHIPLHTNKVLKEIINISKLFKKNGAKVILIGKIATYNPEIVLKENSCIDLCISYNAEETLIKLLKLNSLDKKLLEKIPNITFYNNGIIKTKTLKLNNYNNFPIPDRSLLELDDYINIRTILSSRGCFFKCSFCHVPGFWGNWQAKSANSVIEEIEYLIKEYKAKKILFLDDNTIIDKNRMRLISELIIQKGIKIKLGCLGAIKSFDEKTMKIMYKAGFRWIHYGIETGDENLSKKIHKNLKREEIISVINKTKKIGFKIRTSWILDLDIQSIDSTINLIKDIQTDEIRLHFLSIRYGSEIYNKFNKKNNFPTQYIHSAKSEIYKSKILNKKVGNITTYLKNNGYQLLKNIKDNNHINTEKKIVSLCPLKYGINW